MKRLPFGDTFRLRTTGFHRFPCPVYSGRARCFASHHAQSAGTQATCFGGLNEAMENLL